VKSSRPRSTPWRTCPTIGLLEVAQKMTEGERRAVLDAYVGRRTNRRHRRDARWKRTSYRFDVLADYGAFRDLQRHRLLTLEWQRLSPHHGSVMPEAIAEARVDDRWHRSLDASAALHDAIAAAGLAEVASLRGGHGLPHPFLHGRERARAMHLIELRSGPQGHPAYRRIAQTMQPADRRAGRHRALAAAMTFADHSEVALERLEAERAAERRRGDLTTGRRGGWTTRRGAAMTMGVVAAGVEAALRARAHDYLRDNGTLAPTAAIRRRVTQAFENLEKFLRGAEPRHAARRAWPAEWSLHEIADHVVQTHRPSRDELASCSPAAGRPARRSRPRSSRRIRSDARGRPCSTTSPVCTPTSSPTSPRARRLPDERAARVVVVMNGEATDGTSVPLAWEDEIELEGLRRLLRLHTSTT